MTWRDDLRWRLWAKDRRKIFIGPWSSEMGFETLYWLPWLAKWRARYGITKDRLIAVSRGGAGIWYDAGKSVELYDYLPVAKVRQAMIADAQQHGSVKQQRMNAWERKLLPLMAEGLGIRRYHVLHPSAMYNGLSEWWAGRMGMESALQQMHFSPVPVPFPPLDLPLPEKFVAVRFYARHTFPISEELRNWVATRVDALAKHLPVVVLDSGLHADDHMDFPVKGPNILSIAPYVTPQNNLAVASAVLAKAQCFVGTYGGILQLAVRLKRPSVGYYQKFEGTAPAHKQLTEWLGMTTGVPVFIGRPDDAKLVHEVMS